LKALLLVGLVGGVLLSFFAFYMSTFYGNHWLTEATDFGWHLNNYVVVPSWIAYGGFGVGALWLGGLLSGVLLSCGFFFRLFSKRHWKGALALTLAAVSLATIGFNTLDWMCGNEYWAGGAAVAKEVSLFGNGRFELNAWNYYFLFLVLPLFASGFLIGLCSVWLCKLLRK
jgi:hypothetical protein